MVIASQPNGKRSSRLEFHIGQVGIHLEDGELETELDLAWVGGQLDKGEEHNTEYYFVQVGVNLGSITLNVGKSVDTIC